jgi:hypothetical protein
VVLQNLRGTKRDEQTGGQQRRHSPAAEIAV